MAGSEWGSPPRVRGKVYMRCCACLPPRITPACAGKSEQAFPVDGRNWDHPRVCGEKHHPTQSSAGSRGSPPRVRGKAALAFFRVLCYRITPACAGKSCGYFVVCRYLQDHPRVCGEKINDAAPRSNNPGSPPRVRGKEEDEAAKGQAHGITPACAGKSDGAHLQRRR